MAVRAELPPARFLRVALVLPLAWLLLVASCVSLDRPVLAQTGFARETVASGLDWPVSFAFAPDGRILYNERFTGDVREVVDGQVSPGSLWTFPVSTAGEQGLLGLALDPGFPTEPWIYAYHTMFDAGLDRDINRVVRVPASPSVLMPEILLDRIPAGTVHNGGILGFAPDGTLFITTGDAGTSANAQDNGTLAGKVLRINRDGTIPPDNPIPGSPVYSLGHRNMFGLAFHPESARPYVSENGPSSNDEINRIEPGRNYGWPVVLGPADDPRFVDPILAFQDVIAPTGVAFYTGSVVAWRHNLFLGDWNRGILQRIELGADGRQVLGTETIEDVGAAGILDVEMGPDGFLYFSTPEAIYRLRTAVPPAASPGAVDYTLAAIGLLLTIAAVGFIAFVWLLGRRRRAASA